MIVTTLAIMPGLAAANDGIDVAAFHGGQSGDEESAFDDLDVRRDDLGVTAGQRELCALERPGKAIRIDLLDGGAADEP